MRPRFVVLSVVLAVLSAILAWIVRYDPLSARLAAPVLDEDAGFSDEEPELLAVWQPLPNEDEPPRARGLTERTGIEIRYATADFVAPGGKITGSAAAKSDLRSTASEVVEELERYPESYLRASRLRTVILAGNIRGGGREWGGIASPANRALLLRTSASPAFRRHAFHHEIFHLFDRGRFDRAGWAALNPPGFAYDARLGLTSVPGFENGIDRALYGFISRYAMTNADEDRAETFAWMMIDYDEMMQIAGHDPILTAKIRRIEQDVGARVADMGDSFFRSLAGER